MSALGALRKATGYAADNPCCSNCVKYIAPNTKVQSNSAGGKVIPIAFCKRFHFSVHVTGCCDFWRGWDGSILDTIFTQDQRSRVQALKNKVSKTSKGTP